jgi:hypothetical protein
VPALAASKNFAVWVADWPNGIQWTMLNEKSGAFAPQGIRIALEDLNFASLFLRDLQLCSAYS